jgi:hypothetical protein
MHLKAWMQMMSETQSVRYRLGDGYLFNKASRKPRLDYKFARIPLDRK